MFGMNKTINTRVDHTAGFKRTIDHAISEAADASVPTRELISYLTWWARRLEDQAFRHYQPPKMHDASGKPI